jgi:diazepam-binding inhibitor (GABA receptor modulating acyl-CoA-binding protein)
MDMDKILFDAAVSAVQDLSTTPDNTTLLELYSYYKQATVGKCNISQPWAVQVKARAKWDAWDTLGNMSKKTAMQKYVELVNRLVTESN